MLTESQCMIIEQVLTKDVEPRKLAAYLCLHMGLSVAEVSALLISDIDLNTGTVSISKTLSHSQAKREDCQFIPYDCARILLMPPHVLRLFEQNIGLYPDSDCYVINAEHSVSGTHLLQNTLMSINTKYEITEKLTPSKLRDAFTRRSLECGMDMYTVAEYLGLKQVSDLQRRFSQFLKSNQKTIRAMERYSVGYVTPKDTQKRMNLLILGAGSQGPVVKEIAEKIGVFHEIAFLDDDPANKLAMDTCGHYLRYLSNYPIAIPSFGDSFLREKWANLVEAAGFVLPTLIDPSATVSNTAVIKEAVVVEAKAIISAGAVISRGNIISSGSVIEVAAKVQEYAHVGASVTVGKNAVVPAYARISSGTVVRADAKK